MEEEILNKEAEETTARMELEQLLDEVLSEEEKTGNVEEDALKYIKGQIEFNQKMIDALAEDTRFAQAMAEVVNGRSKAPAALARYYGNSFLSAEEGTPEYDEMMRVEEERNAEAENIRKATEEYNKNFEESMKSIEPFAKENGVDADEFRMEIEDKILIPLLEGKWGTGLLTMLKKALDYDKDTEDAFAAGEIQGRNTNINKMRTKASDGLPTGLSSQAAPAVERPKVKRNPLIADALNA